MFCDYRSDERGANTAVEGGLSRPPAPARETSLRRAVSEPGYLVAAAGAPKRFRSHSLVGKYLFQADAIPSWAYIIGNTATTITTLGAPYGPFGDYTLYDLHLTTGSPCIDTGWDNAPLRLPTDFAGSP